MIEDIEDITRQCVQDSHDWFPDKSADLPFLVLCLAGEVGELANLVKKVARGTHTAEVLQNKIEEETTDVFIYLMNIVGLLADRNGFDIVEAYAMKRDENVERFAIHRLTHPTTTTGYVLGIEATTFNE